MGSLKFNEPGVKYWLFGVRIWQIKTIFSRKLYEFRGFNVLNGTYCFIERGSNNTMIYVTAEGIQQGMIRPFLHNFERLDISTPIIEVKE